MHIARSTITRYFEFSRQRVWKRAELDTLLACQQSEWQLPPAIGIKAFTELLTSQGILVCEELELSRKETRYIREPSTAVEMAMSLGPPGYLSHASAVFLHGLIPTQPETLYFNQEQRGTGANGSILTQEGIDAAFQRPPKRSNNRALYRDVEICRVSGKYTGDLGVIVEEHPRYGTLRFTDLPRTLVDVALRPSCAGGTRAVLEAYRGAVGRFSVETLAETLEELEHKYPWHQAIGFYLNRSGCYDEADLEHFRRMPMEFDFYLDYQMEEPAYCPEWRLYYPRQMDETAAHNEEYSAEQPSEMNPV